MDSYDRDPEWNYMDYRELLIKYIALVRSEAGYDYLLYVPIHQMNVEEAKELCKLSKESERYYVS